MKTDATHKILVLAVVVITILMMGCFTIHEVDQPTSATAGEQISITVTCSAEEEAETIERHMLFGLLVPNDFTVNTVTYEGDFEGTCELLTAETALRDTVGPYKDAQTWYDSTEAYYPSGDDMQWVLFQGIESHTKPGKEDTLWFDVAIDMTVGNTNGTYNLGYLLSMVNLDFTEEGYMDVSLENPITVTGGTAIDNSVEMVSEFKLAQNFPNPFNPTTNIGFEIPENSFVTLSVFDMMGREVMQLVNGYREAGSYNVTFDGTDLASGIYFYKLQAGNFSRTMKMVLSK